MIKILNTYQIKQADEYTIRHEPVSSLNLMERAANAFVCQFNKDFPDNNLPVHIFCGKGNNGGDGLAIARILSDKKQSVCTYIFSSKKYSNDFNKNLSRFEKKYKKHIHFIEDNSFIKKIPKQSIIIDAIFGTGLNAKIKEESTEFKIIQEINNNAFYQVISVDIPSGLFTYEPTNGIVVNANKTYTFQFPKLSFLLPETGKFANDFTVLDIGLHQKSITRIKTPFYFLIPDDISKIIHQRKKYSHKGNFGHALLIAGSYGKIGAAVLSAKASLRSGCGLVTVHIPKCGYQTIQSLFPEAMCSIDKNLNYFSGISSIENYDTIGIGPGLGTHTATVRAIEILLKKIKSPVIIDADGLNILSLKKSLLKLLPENSILTPHPKEFERLAGKWTNDFERLELQQKFSEKHKVIVVLKGANTSISDQNGNIYFNSTGNSGMATAGSGDVLTGIITGLLAQHYSPLDAAITGVFLHGLAGDSALQSQSKESMIASDIIDNLGNAFKKIKNNLFE